MKKNYLFALTLTVWLVSCAAAEDPTKAALKLNPKPNLMNIITDTATFGEGCFWCTEAFFQRLKGVKEVLSGYGGGFVENPT